jgi:hypothetical protein
MPTRWVFRRDIEGILVSPPLKCFIEGAIAAEPGHRTVGQCIASLLDDGESCPSEGLIRFVHKDRQVVGSIHISREHPERLGSAPTETRHFD